ncbi:MAG: hypothetical protein IJ637_00850 [Prevotella sp.]|nr:hypothetical protein [Prevotella sp.]
MKRLLTHLTGMLTALLLLSACSMADGGLPDMGTESLNRLVERTDAVSSGDVVVYLLAGEQLVATDAVEVTAGKRLVLRGFKEAPAKIVLGKEGFVTGCGLELENVEIDASALSAPLIVPSVDAGAEYSGGYYHVDDITLRNVKITGLKSSVIIADSCAPFSIESLSVEGCTLLLTTKPAQGKPLVSLPKGRVQKSHIGSTTITQ